MKKGPVQLLPVRELNVHNGDKVAIKYNGNVIFLEIQGTSGVARVQMSALMARDLYWGINSAIAKVT